MIFFYIITNILLLTIGLKYLVISFSIVLMSNIFVKENNYSIKIRSEHKIQIMENCRIREQNIKKLRIRKQIFLIQI